MDDQARKVFISIVAVLLFLFPGIGLICFGLVSLVDSVLGFRFFASDLSTYQDPLSWMRLNTRAWAGPRLLLWMSR
jgi:hypothetical protein